MQDESIYNLQENVSQNGQGEEMKQEESIGGLLQGGNQ